MAVCRYHPERNGIGVCMRCRAVICAACCTRVEGVNHCHACLKTLGQRRPSHGGAQVLLALGAVGVLSVTWVFFVGLLWLVQGSLAP